MSPAGGRQKQCNLQLIRGGCQGSGTEDSREGTQSGKPESGSMETLGGAGQKEKLGKIKIRQG